MGQAMFRPKKMVGSCWFIAKNHSFARPICVHRVPEDCPLTSMIYLQWLVGGWPTPLKNMSSSVGVTIPNIWKNKTCSKMFQTTNQMMIFPDSYRKVDLPRPKVMAGSSKTLPGRPNMEALKPQIPDELGTGSNICLVMSSNILKSWF